MTVLSRLVILPLISATLALTLEQGPLGAPAEAFLKPNRLVAEIVSPQWTRERRRKRADEVGQVARLMGIKPGETVADIGAGSGYYVFHPAKIFGPSGRVLSEDITPDYLAALEKRGAESRQTNIVVIRGEAHDPRLPPASVHAAVLVHMYHEIGQLYGLLHSLAATMKRGGQVGIVDSDDILSRHGTPPKLLRCEMAVVGYRRTAFRVLKGGACDPAIFQAPAHEARPDPATIKPYTDKASRGRR